MLESAEITISGMTDTTIDRIGQSVSEGLASGESIQSLGKELRSVLEDPGRSEIVANTEMARASSAASMQTYEQNGIAQCEWLAEGSACPSCEDNADGSPYDLSDAPDCPDHPSCRCALAPVVDLGTPEAGGEESS